MKTNKQTNLNLGKRINGDLSNASDEILHFLNNNGGRIVEGVLLLEPELDYNKMSLQDVLSLNPDPHSQRAFITGVDWTLKTLGLEGIFQKFPGMPEGEE